MSDQFHPDREVRQVWGLFHGGPDYDPAMEPAEPPVPTGPLRPATPNAPRLCPLCSTDLTPVRGRRRGSRGLWCWKCEKHWKAGIREGSKDA
jgi:hypothetical protein